MRAFLAIELDTNVREGVAACQQQLRSHVLTADPSARVRVSWTALETMHLTMKFLGEIEEASASTLERALVPVAGAIGPFTIPLADLGAFPSAREPKVLWIGPPETWAGTEDAGKLRALHRMLDEAAATIGVARDDRPFNPHLTLARVRDGSRDLGRLLAASGALSRPPDVPPLTVCDVVLIKSVLTPTAPQHTVLWRFST